MVYHGLPYGLPWFTMVQWQFQSRPSKKYVFFSWPDQCSGPHRQMCSKHFDKNMLHQFQNLRPKVGSEQMWRVGDASYRVESLPASRHIAEHPWGLSILGLFDQQPLGRRKEKSFILQWNMICEIVYVWVLEYGWIWFSCWLSRRWYLYFWNIFSIWVLSTYCLARIIAFKDVLKQGVWFNTGAAVRCGEPHCRGQCIILRFI